MQAVPMGKMRCGQITWSQFGSPEQRVLAGIRDPGYCGAPWTARRLDDTPAEPTTRASGGSGTSSSSRSVRRQRTCAIRPSRRRHSPGIVSSRTLLRGVRSPPSIAPGSTWSCMEHD